jgi:hypothetical protein
LASRCSALRRRIILFYILANRIQATFFFLSAQRFFIPALIRLRAAGDKRLPFGGVAGFGAPSNSGTSLTRLITVEPFQYRIRSSLETLIPRIHNCLAETLDLELVCGEPVDLSALDVGPEIRRNW